MKKLVVRAATSKEVRGLKKRFLDSRSGKGGRDWRGAFTVESYGHVLTFRFIEELRFGPPYYSVSVEGPYAETIRPHLADEQFLCRIEPGHPDLPLIILERLDRKTIEKCLLVFDLEKGKKCASLNGFFQPHHWRPGSPELLCVDQTTMNWVAWRVLPPLGRRTLVEGYNSSCVSGDGKWMIAFETGRPRVALVDLEAGAVTNRLTKRHFKPLCEKPQTLTEADFDPATSTLYLFVDYGLERINGRWKLSFDAAAVLEIK